MLQATHCHAVRRASARRAAARHDADRRAGAAQWRFLLSHPLFAAPVIGSRRVGGSGGCSFSARRHSPSLLSVRRAAFPRRGVGGAPARRRRGCEAALPPVVPRRVCCAADALVPRRAFPGFVRGDGRSLARRPARSPALGQRVDDVDGGGVGDDGGVLRGSRVAQPRRRHGYAPPDLRRRCDGGDTWRLATSAAVLAWRATARPLRRRPLPRPRRPVPGRHAAIAPSGDSHDDRDVAATKGGGGCGGGGGMCG